MKTNLLNAQLALFPMEIWEAPEGNTQDNKPDEKWLQSIPAQVFLNHFFAVDYHIRQSLEAYSLYNMPHFLNYHPTMTDEEVNATKRLLYNCWNTEYALRSTGSLGDAQYLRYAIHWTFPQAYYSILFGIRAFLMTHGVTGNNEDLVRREIGQLVVKGFYPLPLAFYAAGHYDQYVVHRLPLATEREKNALTLPNHEVEAQTQISQFLKTTRNLRAKSIRRYVQNNPELAIRGKSGEVLEKFSAENWKQLTWRLGYTTFFDLLTRLKISSNSREIERFTEADINFRLFYQSLMNLVSYINFIHESYVAKAMGLEKYQAFLEQLPPHLGFVQARLRSKVMDVFQPLEELKPRLSIAA